MKYCGVAPDYLTNVQPAAGRRRLRGFSGSKESDMKSSLLLALMAALLIAADKPKDAAAEDRQSG